MVVMISSKQIKKSINHAQNFSLIMINPQRSKKTVATSRLIDQCSSRQQQLIDNVLDEHQNVFQEPNEVPLHFQVKQSIELVPGSSLPNAYFYRRSILENKEIHRKIQDLIDKGQIFPSSSRFGSLVVLVPKKYGTWHMCID